MSRFISGKTLNDIKTSIPTSTLLYIYHTKTISPPQLYVALVLLQCIPQYIFLKDKHQTNGELYGVTEYQRGSIWTVLVSIPPLTVSPIGFVFIHNIPGAALLRSSKPHSVPHNS